MVKANRFAAKSEGESYPSPKVIGEGVRTEKYKSKEAILRVPLRHWIAKGNSPLRLWRRTYPFRLCIFFTPKGYAKDYRRMYESKIHSVAKILIYPFTPVHLYPVGVRARGTGYRGTGA